MDDQTLLDLAVSWSFFDKPPPKSVPRRIKLPHSLSNRVALIIQGVRRCGKSTLLSQLMGRYDLDRQDCLFVNFEDPRLASHLGFETLERLTELFKASRPKDRQLTFFFDEIQWVQGWERWLCAKLERPDRSSFVVSGSNAHLLSGELSTLLTGRHITVELFPFDLAEYRALQPKASTLEYLKRGGFPEPATSDDGEALLRQYFIDILQRDVRERAQARSSLALRQVAQMVFESAGSELSLRRIAAAAGLSVETAASYLEACEQAYLLFACPWFSYSERKRSGRNRKYYPVDPGLRRVTVSASGEDLGKALECATFVELKKRCGDVYYWREAGEVDFVVHGQRGPVPIQVTLKTPSERYMRALDAFFESFPHAEEPVMVNPEGFPNALDAIPTRH